jgi:hypothetical protein
MDPDHGRRDTALTPNAGRKDAAKWWWRPGLVAVLLACGVSSLATHTTPALGAQSVTIQVLDRDGGSDSSGPRRFVSASDSVDWDRVKTLAASARGFRLVISLLDRRMWAIIGADTLLDTPVAVASGTSLSYQGRRWSFTTPRGVRNVVAKDSLPVWVPPDWHYYEVAKARGLVVRQLLPGQPAMLEDGRRLEIRSSIVGIVGADSLFRPLPTDAEIIYDGFLYVPPLGTANRRIAGELGRYRIDLGGGLLLHGTPDAESIGTAATHGCIRLRDDDIAWLFEFVPLGVRVYIY